MFASVLNCRSHSLPFQTVQHGSCAGLPCPARHRGDHGLWAGWQHSLGELASHQHGSGREEHGSSPQRPWTIHILGWSPLHQHLYSTALPTMTASWHVILVWISWIMTRRCSSGFVAKCTQMCSHTLFQILPEFIWKSQRDHAQSASNRQMYNKYVAFIPHIYAHYCVFCCEISLDSFFTRPTWTRRTRWSAPQPSYGRLTITITTYLTALETWSNMSCACQPSNFKREGKGGLFGAYV